jgi:choline dehydrogenase-like flavoprotein
VAEAGGRLGRRWTTNSLAILSGPYRGRPGCNYCANCARGCPRGDKGSVDVTFIPAALATGRCTLRSDTRVLRIERGDRDRVDALLCVGADGAQRRIATRALVLACGAIETPRLLLNSGLGNESGQVGHNLLENITWATMALHPEPLGSHRGLPVDAKCWDFNAPDAVPGLVGGCTLSVATAQANLVGPYQYARRVVGGWGRAHKQAMREQFGRALTLSGDGESLPNPGTFVDLDPQRRDTDGLPLARIHSRLDDMAIARLRFLRAQCRAALAACGADDIFEEFGTYDHFSSSHVFGTCRMGDAPEQSVVDRWGRSHRWRNLFVADASVFPSSGGGEAPSLTIQALALRTAGHIRELALHDAL